MSVAGMNPALLNFCLSHSGDPAERPTAPLSEAEEAERAERLAWLKEVLAAAASPTDQALVLLKAARDIVQGGASSSSTGTDAELADLLVRMTEAAEDLDVGVDLLKAAGASDVIQYCLASTNGTVVRECARFVATAAANESRAQKVLIEQGVLAQLLSALRREADRSDGDFDERLFLALVGALSSLADEGLCRVLVANTAFLSIVGGLLVRSRSRRVYARVFVLFRKLAAVDAPALAAELVATPAILHVACASSVDAKSITLRDAAVRLLRPVLTASPAAAAVCASVQLDQLLRERIARANAATTDDEHDDLEGVAELLALVADGAKATTQQVSE